MKAKSGFATIPITTSRSKINSNIYVNARKAIVIRSRHVDNGATVGLVSNFSEKTGALKVGVRMSQPLEAHRPIVSNRTGLPPRKP
jgi:hypothetical protein